MTRLTNTDKLEVKDKRLYFLPFCILTFLLWALYPAVTAALWNLIHLFNVGDAEGYIVLLIILYFPASFALVVYIQKWLWKTVNVNESWHRSLNKDVSVGLLPLICVFEYYYFMHWREEAGAKEAGVLGTISFFLILWACVIVIHQLNKRPPDLKQTLSSGPQNNTNSDSHNP